MKSSLFQLSLKYEFLSITNPNAMILQKDSNVNIIVKIISKISNNFINYVLLSFMYVSITSLIEDSIITIKIKLSNHLAFDIEYIFFRNQFVYGKIYNESQHSILWKYINGFFFFLVSSSSCITLLTLYSFEGT